MSGPVEISRRDARRVALAAQGFLDPAPRGKVDRRHFRRVLDRLATVQLDSVNVLARSHELVFFSRLGAYDREALSRWLWRSREVFEYWGHEASLHPMDRHPLLRWRMAEDHAWGGVRRSAAANPDLVAAALAEIAERGPVGMSDLSVHRAAPRRGDEGYVGTERKGEAADSQSTGWWGWGDGKRVVEHLFWAGQVTAVRRNGFARHYLLPERWIPADVLDLPAPAAEEAHRELLLIAARAHGVGTARDLADYYRLNVPASAPVLDGLVADGRLLPARIEGRKPPAYLHPDARWPKRRVRARALLSPFDSLIWERQRTDQLWGFHYRLEIYVPAAKRVHGYYVLPFLLGESLVGRVDLKADRQAGILRVKAAWAEDTVPELDRVAAELATTLGEMAAWMGLAEGVAVDGRGDLAPHLAQAIGA
jgi:uncharacterized protein